MFNRAPGRFVDAFAYSTYHGEELRRLAKGLRYRYACRFARFSRQLMANVLFSGICDAEDVV